MSKWNEPIKIAQEHENIIYLKTDQCHLKRVGRYLQEDYHGSQRLCDVEILLENKTIVKAHSVILAEFSLAYHENFANSQEFRLDLSKFKQNSILRILNWIYDGKAKFKIESLSNDFEAIFWLGIGVLQKELETKIVDISKMGGTTEILNSITKALKFIPHSSDVTLPISDETLLELVTHFHTSGISYRKILKLTPYTVITILASRIDDTKKVDMINVALKWIYECRIMDELASSILRSITFGSMTYEMLINFRNSLVQTAIPVTVGRRVRLRRQENDRLEIIFDSGNSSTTTLSTSASFSFVSHTANNKSNKLCSSSTISESSKSEGSKKSSKNDEGSKFRPSCSSNSIISNRDYYGIDDCQTAIPFTKEDLEILGIKQTSH